MATATLQDLRDIFYSILREEEDVSAYPLVFVDQLLNSAQLRIAAGLVVNPLTKESVVKWQLPFLNKDKFYSNIQPVTLSEDASEWDDVLTVSDTSNFPSTGNLYIAGNIISYTGKTSTTFTWCDNVLFGFSSGIEVWFAFELPTDYSSALNVIYANRFKLPQILYDDIFETLNQYKGSAYSRYQTVNWPYNDKFRINPFYSIKDWQYILIFQMNNTWDMIRLRYEKIPTDMVASTDEWRKTEDV